MDKKITNILAEKILDSRGNPTLRVNVYVGEISDKFDVPSGASTGKYEACELRDSDHKNISLAIEKINNNIKNNLIGIEIDKQEEIDKIMIDLDSTNQKTNLGGNSMIGVSISCAKTASKVLNLEVYEYLRKLKEIKPSRKEPYLYFNLINGGKHAKTNLVFQEFHIVPQVETSEESVKISLDIQNKLDQILENEYKTIEKGDEGGVALNVDNIFTPLELIKRATDELGYENKIKFALDVAASSFFDESNNVYKFMNKNWSRENIINIYKDICNKYPMISIEDPLNEEDFLGFSVLQKEIKGVKLIGDDLTVTNSQRLKIAIDQKSIEGLIIKPNQIGTLTETLNTMKLARDNGIECIISHRSGETMDDFIADLACAFGCFGIKAGALGPKERNVKYDRIIKINKK